MPVRRKRKEPAAKTISGLVRAAAKDMGRFNMNDINYYDYGRFVSKKRLKSAVWDLRKSGEIVKIKDEEYEYREKKKPRTKLDIMWHLIRSRRQFSTDEIEMLSESKRATVREYLNCLRKFGYIRQVKIGHWQLINDPGPETPVNTYKCAKLKRLRQEKKDASKK